MLSIDLSANLRPAERFFIEKSLELVHPKTIDTYRCRLFNPHTILIELHSVLLYWHHNKIKSFEAVQKVKEEALKLLSTNNHLDFNSFDPIYFKSQIGKIEKNYYLDTLYSLSLILKVNQNYWYKLIKETYREISKCNVNVALSSSGLKQLNETITFLITELVNIGYSKKFLNKFLYKTFIIESDETNFRNKYNNIIKRLKRSPENFDIFFRLYLPLSLQDTLIKSNHVPTIETLRSFFETGNSETKGFLKYMDSRRIKYLHFKISSVDYHSASVKTRPKLAEILDSIFLGFNHANVELYHKALVIGEASPQSANTELVYYPIDGSYSEGQEVYETFIESLGRFESNIKVSRESKQKIRSGIRYLRLGSEAIELEQKFISYWMGLEYIFSNYDTDSNTFNRISEYFTNAHLSVFFTRNLRELHNDIKRLGYNDTIKDYSPNLIYLIDVATYLQLEKISFDEHPLMAFRANEFGQYIKDVSARTDYINRHQKDLVWNIARLYRLRNEIIHEAAIDANIPNITGHIKYYLTFIISSIIHYFVTDSTDVDNDNYATIDDFFIVQKLKLENLKASRYDLNKILEVYVP